MSQPVLQARYVGQAPDRRGKMHPAEHVFVCEEPKFSLIDWSNRVLGYALGWLTIVLCATAILYVFGINVRSVLIALFGG